MFHQKPLLGKLPLWIPNPAGIVAPVGAWVANEGSGDKIHDTSGNGMVLGKTGVSTWCFTQKGAAIDQADGVNYYQGAVKGAASIPSGDFTIIASIFPDDAVQWECLIQVGASAGNRYGLYLTANDVSCVSGNSYNITAGNYIVAGNHYEIAYVHKSGIGEHVYVNGNYKTANASLSDPTSPGGNVQIGYSVIQNAYSFDGRHIFYYIFNQALTSTQIAYIHQHPYYAWEYPELWELYAAAAGGTDETNKLISISSTLSGVDKQAYKDLQKLIAITSAIQGADIQAYKELNKQILVAATIIGADKQAYIDTEKLIEIVSAIQGADIQAYKELSKQILVTSTISATDIQGFIESLLVGITATISEADLLSYNERNRTIPITATISVSDLQAYKDIVNILIASAVSKTDLQSYKDIADIDVISTLEGIDKQAYKDTGEIPISSAFTASDFQFYVDQGIISITCTLSETDSISILAPAEVRMTFKLVPRITDFTLAQRNKDFKLVERTKDFEILH